ncbi:zinc finger-containing ubiquitin peptidase 1-like isoform X2 [Daktulosphaira vitifoliae]|uniref:zinc finger-containing ubiquitin peptidase 1-like isoform X2 n=1 Tax=Daktulosphaira vitifoliae TaxID=58002 RepID=UPI0021AA3703|nr:zinc finger-containing ubiquitin peptidase 1-like isoform X2 [Daktulosphaira vitifoliae]
MNFDSILIFLIFTTYRSFCWKLSNNDFECPFCSIKESSACHLISHINNEHTENEITICPECYKEFQYGSILEVHIHLNHAEKNTLQSVNEPDFLYAKQLQQQFDKEAFEQEDNERQRKFKEKFLEPPTVKNITEHIRRLSENSPEVRAVYLASPTDYYMSARADLRYGCVFRSLQMLLSSVILNADYQNHIVNMWIENCNTIISRSRMPNVSFLEYHLEESWNKGIHNWRKGQLYSRSNFPTKQGCVEADMDAIFLGMRIKSEYIIFQGGYYRNRLDDMLNWLRDYFRNENGKEYLPPITLLYPYVQKDELLLFTSLYKIVTKKYRL